MRLPSSTATPVGWSPIRWPWEARRWTAADRELQQLRRRLTEVQGRQGEETAVSPEEFQRTRDQAMELVRRHRRLFGLWHYRFRRWVRRPFVAFVALIPRVGEEIARRLIRPPYPLDLGREQRVALQHKLLAQIIMQANEAGVLEDMPSEAIARALAQAEALLEDHSMAVITLCDPATPRRMRELVVDEMLDDDAPDLENVLLEDPVPPSATFELTDMAVRRLA